MGHHPPLHQAGFEAAAIDPELRGLVNQWVDEAVADIETGLREAGRFEPEARHAHGMLAFAQLDYVARVRAEGRTQDGIDRMIDMLADSWTHLLAEGATPAAG